VVLVIVKGVVDFLPHDVVSASAKITDNIIATNFLFIVILLKS